MGRSIQEEGLEQILGRSTKNHYIIPPQYQRRYSWDQDRWNTLFADVTNIISDTESHFMSTVILQKQTQSDDIMVVDGQQRLITFSLLAQSLIDVIEEINHKDHGYLVSDELKKELITTIWVVEKKRGEITLISPKLKPLTQDAHDYELVLSAFRVGTNLAKNTSKFVEAYRFFTKKISSRLTTLDSIDEKEDYLDSFAENLLRNMHFIVFWLEADENARKIFESVNGLSEPLYVGELIKNYTLIGVSQHEGLQLYNEYWSKIDSENWSDTPEDKEDFETFVYYWLFSQNRKPDRKKRNYIYSAYKEEFMEADDDSDEDVIAFTKRFFSSLYLYETVTGKNITSATLAEASYSATIVSEARTLYQRVAIGCQEPRILILIMRLANICMALNLNDSQVKETFALLANYYVRRSLLNEKTQKSGTNTEFLLDLLNQSETYALEHEVETVAKDFILHFKVNLMNQATRKALKWISNKALYEEITLLMIERPVFGKMLLLEIENHQNRNFPYAKIISASEYQLEHWLPQESDSTKWPLQNESLRGLKTYTLGNLTLLTAEQNRLLSNNSLQHKKLAMNNYLVANNKKEYGVYIIDTIVDLINSEGTWEEKQIDERTRFLAKLILEEIFPDLTTAKLDTSLISKSTTQDRARDTPLWQNPKHGRKLTYKTDQYRIDAEQTHEGKVIVTKIWAAPQEVIASQENQIAARNALFPLSERIVKDGLYSWEGKTEPTAPAKALSLALGRPTKNTWVER